jgi:hypothetical protein
MFEAPAQLGKIFVIIGFVLVILGLVLLLGSRLGFLGLGRLPGDIAFKGKNVAFYFPVVTCLVLSVLLTFVLWLFSFFSRR